MRGLQLGPQSGRDAHRRVLERWAQLTPQFRPKFPARNASCSDAGGKLGLTRCRQVTLSVAQRTQETFNSLIKFRWIIKVRQMAGARNVNEGTVDNLVVH